MCKCNCGGHAEVLDQSEEYRRWWEITHTPLDAAVRAQRKDDVEIGAAIAPWIERLTQRKAAG